MTHSLFAWQRAVIASGMPAGVQVTALRIGLDSTQSTGRDVVINAATVAEDVGCSERTVWRRVQVLVEGGWLVQTAKPTYTGAETGGRRARYELIIPGKSSATPRGTMARFLASDGFSSSSSGHVAIDILASKLRRYTALAGIRTDKLTADQADEITALVDAHGDQRLVDHVLRTFRPHDPPQTIQAFLPGWRVMPKPGQLHLTPVPDPCPQPGHSGTVHHCTQCASEQKAAR